MPLKKFLSITAYYGCMLKRILYCISSAWVHQLQHLNVLKMRQLEGAVIHLFLWAQETPNDISAGLRLRQLKSLSMARNYPGRLWSSVLPLIFTVHSKKIAPRLIHNVLFPKPAAAAAPEKFSAPWPPHWTTSSASTAPAWLSVFGPHHTAQYTWPWLVW